MSEEVLPGLSKNCGSSSWIPVIHMLSQKPMTAKRVHGRETDVGSTSGLSSLRSESPPQAGYPAEYKPGELRRTWGKLCTGNEQTQSTRCLSLSLSLS